MHVCTHSPLCWTDADPVTLPPRVDWSFDCAAACPNASDDAEWERTLRHSSGCEDCSRAARAALIEAGALVPHPKRGPKPARLAHLGGRR